MANWVYDLDHWHQKLAMTWAAILYLNMKRYAQVAEVEINPHDETTIDEICFADC